MNVLAAVSLALIVAQQPDDSFFEAKIRPVLAQVCLRCHGPEKASSGLRLDSHAGFLKGGEHGSIMTAAKPSESRLLRALKRIDGTKAMPPDGPLNAAVVADFERWLQLGAHWPDKRVMTSSERHWSFQPVRDVAPPAINANKHVQAIDAFVLAKLQEKNLSPVARANKRTLIRRVTYDLVGLPPSPEEIDTFLKDDSQDAFARVVDRLLASKHYGEKWGRLWLDVVRYADTAGETADFPVPDAWRYRNYVIDAFNNDKPYDEFVREQLAGDIIASRLPFSTARSRFAELTVATGYLSIARRFGYDSLADHYLTIDDTIDTLGKSLLGLTIGCARCHDHKYDPIPAADYYALYGIFESTTYPFAGCEKDKVPKGMTPLIAPGYVDPPMAELQRDLNHHESELAACKSPLQALGIAFRCAEIRKRLDEIKRSFGQAYAVTEGKSHNARIHKRGDPASLGEVVPRRFLSVLGGQPLATESESGRLQLAQWITDPRNPLTARVLVNRIWQGHFGNGLVRTPNDFGTRGQKPTHPELLDYLASRFIADGWSIKRLHRSIMLSDVYQRSSSVTDTQVSGDPENLFLWKYNRRRLSAEEIHDALLTVSGELIVTPATAHPFPDPKTWGFTQHAPFLASYEHNHRAVYLMTQRIKRHSFLALFDGADTNTSTDQRYTTTVAPQALYFMNAPFVHSRAERLADQLQALPGDRLRLDRACLLLYGRPAEENEHSIAGRFLADFVDKDLSINTNERTKKAWAAWLRVMFGSNEFIYID